MPISLSCPDCGATLRVSDDVAGKKIKCPKCATVFPATAEHEMGVVQEPASPRRKAIPYEDDLPLEEGRSSRARRRAIRDIRRQPEDDAVSTLIPYRNVRALAAYYCAVFSTIPCLGLVLGPIAVILGVLGLRYLKTHPEAKGVAHAIIGLAWGGFVAVANWGILVGMVVAGMIH